MYTEDDTYKALIRQPFEKMPGLLYEWQKDWNDRHPNSEYPSTLNLEFAKKYGWTWHEYVDAYSKSKVRM